LFVLQLCDKRAEHPGIAGGEVDERGEYLGSVELRPA
jgi:hypothetical protein